jgi:hypothetical protein
MLQNGFHADRERPTTMIEKRHLLIKSFIIKVG